MSTRDEIISIVVEDLSNFKTRNPINDIPLIRQHINDTIDYEIKSGRLSEAQANRYSQSRMIKEIQRKLRKIKRNVS